MEAAKIVTRYKQNMEQARNTIGCDSGASVLLSIVRTPSALIARISRQSDPPGEAGFRTDIVPLDQLRGGMRLASGRLRESWGYLGEVGAADGDALYHIALVLLETVADPLTPVTTSPLPPEWSTPPKMARPTAANPRAFRGTKFKPPKGGQMPPIDVRPRLCDARALRTLASPLLRFWDSVRPRLAKAGYPDSAVAVALEELQGLRAAKSQWKLPEWIAMTLWERCGHFAGFAEAIRDSAWRQFAEPARYRFFHFIQGFDNQGLSKRRLQAKWRAVRAELPRIEALILATPAEYQPKVIDYLDDWLWCWDDPRRIGEWMRRAYRILPRLMAPPFPTGSEASTAVGWFVELAEDSWRRVLDAPLGNFRALEKECSRTNSARLISLGLKSLLRFLPSFALTAFLSRPKKLAHAAGVLGGLPSDARKGVLEQYGTNPLFLLNPLETPLREACETIARLRPAAAANPIPARLSAWVRDELALKPSQLDRYQRVLAERLTVLRLDLIEHLAIAWLKRGLPVGEPNTSDRHALRMLVDVDDNRRALRRFLKAYWSGDKDFLAQHPETIRWYRKHPHLLRETWETGISISGAMENGRRISLSVERDPLEALKLGTYVGSCLGLGGGLSYSAAAAVLDANKRVLYARDERGTVFGRQLVAISKDDRLVCFQVYPESAPRSVKNLFRDYDRAFAKALGLPVYQGSAGEDSYEIEPVLASHGWDDYEWDLSVE